MISLISTPSGLVISLRGRQYYTFPVGNMYCLLCKSEFMPGLIMYSFQPFTRAAIRHPHLACVSSLPLTARLASGISLVIDRSARFQLWILLRGAVEVFTILKAGLLPCPSTDAAFKVATLPFSSARNGRQLLHLSLYRLWTV